MKKLVALWVVLVLIPIILVACGGKSEGEQLVEDRCVGCHSLDLITEEGKSADGWELTVDRMIFRGAKLDDAERELVIDYLVETYP